MSARASSFASASVRISRPTIAVRTTCGVGRDHPDRDRRNRRRARRITARVATDQVALPVYNQRLRRRADMLALCVTAEPAPPDYVPADAIDPAALENCTVLRDQARGARDAARARRRRRVVLERARLDRRSGPCFARQVKKCAGACVGAETPAAHHPRLREALAPYALKPWPYPGTIAMREANMTRERTDIHLFRDWCWLGTAHDEACARRNGCSIRRAPRSISTFTGCWSGACRERR